jgi:hypothetical protein
MGSLKANDLHFGTLPKDEAQTPFRNDAVARAADIHDWHGASHELCDHVDRHDRANSVGKDLRRSSRVGLLKERPEFG